MDPTSNWSRIAVWRTLVGIVLLAVALFAINWWSQYSTHATPDQALLRTAGGSAPFETVPFAGGVVLFTQPDQDIVAAYFERKNFWGWHVVNSSTNGSASQLAWGIFNEHGQTFFWGNTLSKPAKQVLFHGRGKVYVGQVDAFKLWHIILPFTMHSFYWSQLTTVLPNGETVPMHG